MKISYTIQPGCTIEQEVPGVKPAFAMVAHLQDVFGTKKCGHCGSPDLRLCHRTPQGYEYFSVKCESCGYEMKFGQQKDSGKLFPKGWEPPYQGDGNGNGSAANTAPAQQEPVYQYGPEGYTPPPPPMQQQQPVAAAAGDGLPW